MRIIRYGLALATLGLWLGCSVEVDVDDVRVGSTVQVVRDDGALIEGRLALRDTRRIVIELDGSQTEIPRGEVAWIAVVGPGAPMPAPPATARFREVTVPIGTAFVLDFGTTIDTSANEVGDAVVATVAEAIAADGQEVVPRGAAVSGRVTAVQAAGNVRGRASVTLTFDTLGIAGETYALPARFEATAPATRGEDAKKIGIPAAGGSVIGALLGGGKGAAVGATIGGSAGAGAVLVTPGEELRVPSGTTLGVRTHEDLVLRVPIAR